MSDEDLAEKVAYFKEQELLELSDDETGFPDDGYINAERALAGTKDMPPPPRLVRQRSSFLGPTPRERQAEFEAHSRKLRPSTRDDRRKLKTSSPAPDTDVEIVVQSSPSGNFAQIASASGVQGQTKRLKHKTPLPKMKVNSRSEDEVPFYKRAGVVPRELKNGKNVRLAENITLESDRKQLFKGKIVYFYPNNDISMARRQRIHKIIQLGAAWVTAWRDDVTHVMVDEATHTYGQLLKHLNKSGIPKVVVVKFDPYVPQCIQFNTVLEPTAGRFMVKGAPRSIPPSVTPQTPSSSPQSSLPIKMTKKELCALSTRRTDSISVADSFPPPPGDAPASPPEEIVEDSFVVPSSDPAEQAAKPVDTSGDALAEAINQAKATSHLPLDDEESDNAASTGSTALDSGSESDVETPKASLKRIRMYTTAAKREKSKAGGSKGINQATFQCMNPRATNASASQNPNARTIQVLEDMCKYYDQMQDQWRTLAYRRGVSTLRKQTSKVTTKEEAEALPFIGTRLAEKIEEIVLTDRLRRLDSTRDDPTDQVLRLFLGVYGAGLSQAYKWIQAGHRTLEDLVKKARLTESQKVGIEHYTDFAARIPRAEVRAHGEFVKKELLRMDPGFEVYTMGSYRRGAKDSGDIDLIITKPGATLGRMRTVVFERLVPHLYKLDFLKVSLATSTRSNDGTKWLGASCLPSSTIWRRLDLLLVPENEMGAALIYFTGNDIFNRSMRLLASKKGMRLNQRGLYKDVVRGTNRLKLNQGTLVEGRSEKRIFEILGVPWREPTERIC